MVTFEPPRSGSSQEKENYICSKPKQEVTSFLAGLPQPVPAPAMVPFTISLPVPTLGSLPPPAQPRKLDSQIGSIKEVNKDITLIDLSSDLEDSDDKDTLINEMSEKIRMIDPTS